MTNCAATKQSSRVNAIALAVILHLSDTFQNTRKCPFCRPYFSPSRQKIISRKIQSMWFHITKPWSPPIKRRHMWDKHEREILLRCRFWYVRSILYNGYRAQSDQGKIVVHSNQRGSPVRKVGSHSLQVSELLYLRGFQKPVEKTKTKVISTALVKRTRKLKIWVYLQLRLARPCVHLRWLAISLVEIKFASKSMQVFYRLATLPKSLRKFNLPLLATTCESVWPVLKTNQNIGKQRNEPIRITSNYLWLAQSAEKITRTRCDWFSFCFSLVETLAQYF